MKVGMKVICRGKFAKEFSLPGVVEVVLSKASEGVIAYGVRIVNGNYHVFPKGDVKET